MNIGTFVPSFDSPKSCVTSYLVGSNLTFACRNSVDSPVAMS